MTQRSWKELTTSRSAETIYFTQPVPDHLQINEHTRQRAREAPIIAIDIEASNDRPQGLEFSAISKWGLSILADVTAIGIAFSDRVDDGVVLLGPFDDEEVQFVRDILTREDVLILFHNGQYDMRGLGVHLGLPIPRNTFDTQTCALSMGVVDLKASGLAVQCASYQEVITGDVDYTVTDREHTDYGKSYIEQWTDWHRYKHIKAQRGNLSALPPQDLAWYVLEDARLTFKLYRGQREWADILADDYGYTALPEVILTDQRYTWVTYHWTVEGLPIDTPYIQSQLDWIADKLFEMQIDLSTAGIGTLGGYDDKVRYFFDICNVPRPDPQADDQKILFTRSGKYSFDKDAMKYYANIYPRETAWYQYYTHLEKTQSTLAGYLAHAQLTGRIHPMIGIGTITGRSSASHPNTLNVSVKLPDEVEELDGAKTISARGCVVASPGNVLCEYDYQAAEKRAQTIESGEIFMAEMFRDGLDMHTEFAKIYWPDEWAAAEAAGDKAKLKTKRNAGKPITFGTDYGMGAKKLSRRLGISLNEAQELLNRFAARLPYLARWKRIVQTAAEQNYLRMQDCPNPLFAYGYIENVFGQRILIDRPTWIEEEGRQRTYWYKAANYDPQSLVAYMIKKATWKIFWDLREAGLRSKIQQQYHDAIITDTDPDEAEEVTEIVSWAMSTAIDYDKTLVGDVFVEWPAGINHAENAEKWGYRGFEDYPLATHDEGGKPIEWQTDLEAARTHLLDTYLVEGHDRVVQQYQSFEVVMDAGPWGDDEVYVLWPGDDGLTWLHWAELPRNLADMNQAAQQLYRYRREGHIPVEHTQRVTDFINFVSWALEEKRKIDYNKDTYLRLKGA
jgi:hypothetical protein